ncbi:hypothetical protein M3Y98_01172100 [Aphelenchoides besseyi]|nr:hypothetical protein M3Y98_01172100 [Aphelenchoides besseyi]KAI6210978.1 hypothetical protein M3Y96_00384800 [Aphelenchoides besseyi]
MQTTTSIWYAPLWDTNVMSVAIIFGIIGVLLAIIVVLLCGLSFYLVKRSKEEKAAQEQAAAQAAQAEKEKANQQKTKVVNEVEANTKAKKQEVKASTKTAKLPDEQKQANNVTEQNEKLSRKLKVEHEEDRPGATPRRLSVKSTAAVANEAKANTETENSAATSKRSQIVTEKFLYEA